MPGEQMPVGRAVGADDLAGLDQLLEAAQVVGELRREVPAAQLQRGLAEVAGGRLLGEPARQLGAAVAGSLLEGDGGVGLEYALAQLLRVRPGPLDLLTAPVDRDRLAHAHALA